MWLILVGEGTVFIMIEVKKLISAIFFLFFLYKQSKSEYLSDDNYLERDKERKN